MVNNSFHGFPMDAILKILLLLPAEALIAMRLVCKPWYDLIKESSFIIKHFELSCVNVNDYLLCGPRIYKRHDRMKFRNIPNNNCEILLNKEIPLGFDINNCVVINSCNGLICFTGSHYHGTTIYLFNPFIRKYRCIRTSILGNINLPNGEFDFFDLGFGFHTPTNDHKIIRIGLYKGQFTGNINDEQFTAAAVEVYSLSKNTWERIEVDSFPWITTESLPRTSINDCFHWLVYKKGKLMILSFDFGSQKFEEIGLPNDYHDIDVVEEYSNCLFVINDSKLAFGTTYSTEESKYFMVWMMDTYRVVESWNLIFYEEVTDKNIAVILNCTRNNGIWFDSSTGNVIFYTFENDFMVVRNNLFLLDDPSQN